MNENLDASSEDFGADENEFEIKFIHRDCIQRITSVEVLFHLLIPDHSIFMFFQESELLEWRY